MKDNATMFSRSLQLDSAAVHALRVSGHDLHAAAAGYRLSSLGRVSLERGRLCGCRRRGSREGKTG